MTKLTNSETISKCRAEAKKYGMTFKTQNATINGSPAYKFTSRSTGKTIISNCTLGSAYNIVCAGDIAGNSQV